MIVKGLKVGDTFEDGGREFKVIAVLDNGDYSSEYIGKADPNKEVKPTEEKPKRTRKK